MEKGIKKIIGIIIITFSLLLFNTKLNAATGSITVRSNKTTAVVGSEINVTITISSNEAIGSWQWTLSYDSSKLKLNGSPDVVGFGNGVSKSQSYSYTFKVLARGSSNISVKGANALEYEGETPISLNVGSIRINGITQAELQASYSKNNNLSSLGVTGYELSPSFNKNTTEYTTIVPSDVEKVTLTGELEDKKASVNGLGEFKVSEGENKFDIVVTAENGSQKTYTIKVKVEDKNPIEVIIDGLKYTIIKRASTLTAPNTFEPTTIKINEIEIPAFKSNITGYILVGLKATDGTSDLYIYDAEYNSYTLYKEITTEGIVIFPKKAKTIPDYYKITKVTINGSEVEAYQYEGIEDYYLIYGVNIQTGEECFYQYDMINNTITRYNDSIIKELTKKNENFLTIIIVLGVETIALLLILIITLTRKNKKIKEKKVTLKDFEKALDEKPISKDKQENKENNKVEKANSNTAKKNSDKKDKNDKKVKNK